MQPISASLQIYLFGQPRLEYEGKTTLLPRRERLLCLLARLALQPGEAFSRKNLAFALWPDEPEAEALANLRRHLYLLRNLLPPPLRETLFISSQVVTWQKTPQVWVDVLAFQQAGETPEALERAAELYRGELAQSTEGDDFLIAQREALRQKFLSVLKKLTLKFAARGEPLHALEWSRRLSQEDPWDEEIIRLKMNLEAQTGSRAAALATYQTLARELESELNAQPMPETMSLYSDILHNRVSRPAPPQKSAAPFFLSREAEMAQILHLSQRLSTGLGAVIFISGPAGVGKTSLLQEFLRRLAEQSDKLQARVLWGVCAPPTVSAPPHPYAPWSQILNAAAPLLARSEEIPPEGLNRLLPLVPDLALLKPGLLHLSQPNAAELRTALRQAFRALTQARPFILVVEDAHWADDASLEVLQDLAEICSSLPLLVLVTHRVEELPAPLLQAKRALRQRRALNEIALQPFNAEEARSFVKTLLGEDTLPAELYEELTCYAQGLPLLLRESAEAIRQARGKSASLPTLRDSIALRLESLSPAARKMLEGAALLGFSFSNRELETLLGWSEAAYAAALDSLQARHFLVENLLPGAPEYIFSHQLIHEILLETIPASRAVELHRRAALALQQTHPQEGEFFGQIATHYQKAGLVLPAARFWLEDARQNTEMAAFEPALQAIERAQSLLDGRDCSESRELRAAAALQRGEIAHYRGQAAESLPLLEQALRLCADFPSLRPQALASLAFALYTCDRYAESSQAATESLESARALSDWSAVSRALNIRGIVNLLLGHNAEAMRDLREALSLEQNQAQPSAQTVQTLNHLGTALVFAQEYAEAGEMLQRTAELAQRGGLRRLESAALTMQGQIALNCGKYPRAIEIYTRSIDSAGDSYLPGLWGKFAGRGAVWLRMGKPEKAQEDFQRGLEIARQVQSRYGELLLQVYQSFATLAEARCPAETLSTLERQAAALHLPAVVLLAGLCRARLRRLAGDVEGSLAAGERAIEAARVTNVPQFLQNAQLEWLYAQAQSGAPNRELLALLAQQAAHSGELPQQALAKLTLAATLRIENQPTPALTAASEALTLARACPDRILIGEALLFQLRLHQSLGQTEQAEKCRAELLSLSETAFAPFRLALEPLPDLRKIVKDNG